MVGIKSQGYLISLQSWIFEWLGILGVMREWGWENCGGRSACTLRGVGVAEKLNKFNSIEVYNWVFEGVVYRTKYYRVRGRAGSSPPSAFQKRTK